MRCTKGQVASSCLFLWGRFMYVSLLWWSDIFSCVYSAEMIWHWALRYVLPYVRFMFRRYNKSRSFISPLPASKQKYQQSRSAVRALKDCTWGAAGYLLTCVGSRVGAIVTLWQTTAGVLLLVSSKGLGSRVPGDTFSALCCSRSQKPSPQNTAEACSKGTRPPC